MLSYSEKFGFASSHQSNGMNYRYNLVNSKLIRFEAKYQSLLDPFITSKV